jgi:hypothetical protein
MTDAAKVMEEDFQAMALTPTEPLPAEQLEDDLKLTDLRN